MNTVDQLREALAELPVSDAELSRLGALVNKVEEQNVTGAAAVTALQSARSVVEQLYFKRGEQCPLCHRGGKHAEGCYLRTSSGWDLLEEHEATLRENDELRAALARYIPHNGAVLRSGGKYRSLKDRARLPGRDTT